MSTAISSNDKNFGKVVEQQQVPIPNLTVKDLLSAIPPHCFQRSALRSSLYVIADFAVIIATYKATRFADALLTPEHFALPHPYLYSAASAALWTVYGFITGLVGTGIWVLAHECGHQAFSESKTINNVVGWFLHSAVGVPYHSWRISHAKHHASTSHLTEDQVYVPKTRTQQRLPAFNAEGENLEGSRVSSEVMHEMYEAIGESPLGTIIGEITYLIAGFQMYLVTNASGQKRYPKGPTNHFNPNSAVLFRPHQFGQIIASDIGIFLWIAAQVVYGYKAGLLEVFRVYIVPYIWLTHWLVLITFLQHTDPLLPHYRASSFTFARGALSTFDRSMLGETGKIGAWIGGIATHGIAETHVLHHVSSKIPHYHAWEAADALRARLAQAGITLSGGPVGWGEMYRVFKECKFVEDEGDVVFYKNQYGVAAARAASNNDSDVSDSGVEVDKDSTSD